NDNRTNVVLVKHDHLTVLISTPVQVVPVMGKIKNISFVRMQSIGLRNRTPIRGGSGQCKKTVVVFICRIPPTAVRRRVHPLLIDMVHVRPFVIRRKFYTDHHTVPFKGKILSPKMILIPIYFPLVPTMNK